MTSSSEDAAVYVAPARFVLTVLHRKDPGIPPVTAGPDPSDGVTVCGLPLLLAELWRTVDYRQEDRLCDGCWSGPGSARAAVEDVEVTLW
jgi:hypothetical protein